MKKNLFFLILSSACLCSADYWTLLPEVTNTAGYTLTVWYHYQIPGYPVNYQTNRNGTGSLVIHNSDLCWYDSNTYNNTVLDDYLLYYNGVLVPTNPVSTNTVPLNPSNIVLHAKAAGTNPFRFAVAVDGIWLDNNGNPIGSPIELASSVPAGSDWTAENDALIPPDGAANFKVGVRPAVSVTGDAAALVLNSDGYIDPQFFNVGYMFQVKSSDGGQVLYTSPFYDGAAFKDKVVESSGLGAPERVSTNQVAVAATITGGNAVSTVVGSSPAAQTVAAGTAAALDLSGVIEAVNGGPVSGDGSAEELDMESWEMPAEFLDSVSNALGSVGSALTDRNDFAADLIGGLFQLQLPHSFGKTLTLFLSFGGADICGQTGMTVDFSSNSSGIAALRFFLVGVISVLSVIAALQIYKGTF